MELRGPLGIFRLDGWLAIKGGDLPLWKGVWILGLQACETFRTTLRARKIFAKMKFTALVIALMASLALASPAAVCTIELWEM